MVSHQGEKSSFFRVFLLKKLQSIDSKAFKLAIGVPVHTNTSNSYPEAGMTSLSEQREQSSFFSVFLNNNNNNKGVLWKKMRCSQVSKGQF